MAQPKNKNLANGLFEMTVVSLAIAPIFATLGAAILKTTSGWAPISLSTLAVSAVLGSFVSSLILATAIYLFKKAFPDGTDQAVNNRRDEGIQFLFTLGIWLLSSPLGMAMKFSVTEGIGAFGLASSAIGFAIIFGGVVLLAGAALMWKHYKPKHQGNNNDSIMVDNNDNSSENFVIHQHQQVIDLDNFQSGAVLDIGSTTLYMSKNSSYCRKIRLPPTMLRKKLGLNYHSIVT